MAEPRHLGSFGKEHEPLELTFDYFGQTLHANPTLSDLDYVEFLSVAGGISIDDLASLGAVKDFARMCVSAEDFGTFWSTALAHRQRVEDLFDVLTSIMEASMERPTGRPSDSADGPGSTAARSGAGDSSQALRKLDGRPDLQLFVEKAAAGA